MTIKFYEENTREDISSPADILKNISQQDFLGLGVHDIAYIRPVEVNGERKYSIHAADGTQLSVMDNWETAYGTVLQNDLSAVTVQ
ncbi:MAG: DUF1150 domain-containing protein [Micavibrio sp.]|nr:DUF1150 domain-containing protein [Micavibrio sp.]